MSNNTPEKRARRQAMQRAIRDGQRPYDPEDYVGGATTLMERLRRIKVIQNHSDRERRKHRAN